MPLARTTRWMEGGIYVTPQGDGTYCALKVLRLDVYGAHIRTYSNVYPSIPRQIDETTLYMAGIHDTENERLGTGHMPVSYESFSSWDAVFVQYSSVSQDELEGYHYWLEAEGGFFSTPFNKSFKPT